MRDIADLAKQAHPWRRVCSVTAGHFVGADGPGLGGDELVSNFQSPYVVVVLDVLGGHGCGTGAAMILSKHLLAVDPVLLSAGQEAAYCHTIRLNPPCPRR